MMAHFLQVWVASLTNVDRHGWSDPFPTRSMVSCTMRTPTKTLLNHTSYNGSIARRLCGGSTIVARLAIQHRCRSTLPCDVLCLELVNAIA
jgi:hypothetical protein